MKVTKQKDVLTKLLQWLVSLLALGYVSWKLWEDRTSLAEIWNHIGWENIGWIALAALLVIPNLGLEALKWRQVLHPLYPDVTLKQSTKAILAGMATGIWTPGKVGEYAGRVLYLKEGQRMGALLATFIDRLCQLTITLLAGVWGLSPLASGRPEDALFSEEVDKGLYFLTLLSLTLTITFLLSPSQLTSRIPESWTRRKWLKDLKEAPQHFQEKDLIPVLAMAALRYIVFTSQYLILLLAFGYEGSLQMAVLMIMVVFVAKSVVPVPGILELGIRESIAVQAFAWIGLGAAPAIQATLLLYLINILLPTLVGVWMLRGWQNEKEQEK